MSPFAKERRALAESALQKPCLVRSRAPTNHRRPDTVKCHKSADVPNSGGTAEV